MIAQLRKNPRKNSVEVIGSKKGSHTDSPLTPDAGGQKKRKKNANPEQSESGGSGASNWDITLPLWPLNSRPDIYKNKSVINAMPVDSFLKIISLYREGEQLRDKKAVAGGVKPDDKIPVTTFKAQEDDRKSILHEASLLRMPVSDPETWYDQVPIARNEIVKAIPLKATGSEHAVSDVALEKMHNRANPISLKFFVAENISVSAKPPRETRKYGEEGHSTVTELAWEQAGTISQATEAVISYGCCLQQLWPLDTTGWALIRLFNRFKWLVAVQPSKTRVDLISSSFNRIVKKNSLRAANNQAPIPYEEMESILKDVLVRNNQKPDIPVPGERANYQEQKYSAKSTHNQRYNSSQGQALFGAAQQGQQQQAAFRIPQLPTLHGNKLCHGFNNPGQQCTYAAQAGGNTCKGPRGNIFAHACSNYLLSKSRYCLQSHPKRDCRNK